MSSIKVSEKNARVGANPQPDGGWDFLVWAPQVRSASLVFPGVNDHAVSMEPRGDGYFHTFSERLAPDSQYFYRLDDARNLPDPASRYQPQGVHGPSQVVDLNLFRWTDHDWKGRTLERSVFYELHVGSYTPKRSFDAIIPHLQELADLGITTIELMPVAQFPGSHNWGYD